MNWVCILIGDIPTSEFSRGFAWNLVCWEIQEIRTPKYAKVIAFNVKEFDDGPCFVAMIDVLVFLLKYAQVWGKTRFGPTACPTPQCWARLLRQHRQNCDLEAGLGACNQKIWFFLSPLQFCLYKGILYVPYD